MWANAGVALPARFELLPPTLRRSARPGDADRGTPTRTVVLDPVRGMCRGSGRFAGLELTYLIRRMTQSASVQTRPALWTAHAVA